MRGCVESRAIRADVKVESAGGGSWDLERRMERVSERWRPTPQWVNSGMEEAESTDNRSVAAVRALFADGRDAGVDRWRVATACNRTIAFTAMAGETGLSSA